MSDDLIARLRFEADAEEQFGDGINVSIMREAADALEQPTITDEAVERAAKAMYDHEFGKIGSSWQVEKESGMADYWREHARVALTAALEGDE